MRKAIKTRGKRYEDWRDLVLEVADGKCQICNKKSHLVPHHIKPWKDYPALRYKPNNGIAICYNCHKEIHPWLKTPKSATVKYGQYKVTGGGERAKTKTFTFDFYSFENNPHPLYTGAGAEVFKILYWTSPRSRRPKAPVSLWDDEQTNGEVKLIDSQATP